jgi:hypothetical protein
MPAVGDLVGIGQSFAAHSRRHDRAPQR